MPELQPCNQPDIRTLRNLKYPEIAQLRKDDKKKFKSGVPKSTWWDASHPTISLSSACPEVGCHTFPSRGVPAGHQRREH